MIPFKKLMILFGLVCFCIVLLIIFGRGTELNSIVKGAWHLLSDEKISFLVDVSVLDVYVLFEI